MGKGKRLTEYEKGQIDAFRAKGDGYRTIGKALGRSVGAISDYVNGKTGQTKSNGRPKKLTMQQEIQVVNKASNSTKSLSRIKRELKLNVTKMTNWNVLKQNKFIVRRKIRKAPNFTNDHKVRRLNFAKVNKQYKTVAKLKQAIMAAWNGLTQEMFQNHINSMPNPILQVINLNGDAIDY